MKNRLGRVCWIVFSIWTTFLHWECRRIHSTLKLFSNEVISAFFLHNALSCQMLSGGSSSTSFPLPCHSSLVSSNLPSALALRAMQSKVCFIGSSSVTGMRNFCHSRNCSGWMKNDCMAERYKSKHHFFIDREKGVAFLRLRKSAAGWDKAFA